MERKQIAVKDLFVSGLNARKTFNGEGISELAASIASHGLIHPLIVCAGEKQKGKKKTAPIYNVVAGQRRLLAIMQNVRERVAGFTNDMLIECSVMVGACEADMKEISLAENVTQLPMNPVDQFEAFAALDQSPQEIALRFGITERLVKQRQALARLVPDVRELVRTGKISLLCAQALTVASKEWQQNTYLARLATNPTDYSLNHADSLRRMIQHGGIKRENAIFDLALYTGEVMHDLFSAVDGGGVLADVPMFWELQNAEIVRITEGLIAEGWRKIHRVEHFSDWGHVREAKQKGKPTPALTAAIAHRDELNEKLHVLNEQLEKLTDVETDDEAERLDLEAKIEALQVEISGVDERAETAEETVAKLEEAGMVFSKAAMKRSDVYIEVASGGAVAINKGYVTTAEYRQREEAKRLKDQKKVEESEPDDDDDDDDSEAVVRTPGPADLPEDTRKPAETPEELKGDFEQLDYVQQKLITDALGSAMTMRLTLDVRKALEILVVMLAGKRGGIFLSATGGHLSGRGGEKPLERIAAAMKLAKLEPEIRRQHRQPHEGNAIDLYQNLQDLSDAQLLEVLGAYAAFAFSTTAHVDAFFRTIALDLGMVVRDEWTPDATWLAAYQKGQLAALAEHLKPGEPVKPSNYKKDELIELCLKRMTLCWKPRFASFSTVLRTEKQPNGVEGEGATTPLPPAAANDEDSTAIAAE